jgi:hypothetical protein
MIYTSAEYNRHAGLGNKLFAWSRAKIYSHYYDIPMLTQNWISLRGAAITRGGIDYSKVLGKIILYKNFVNDENEICRLIWDIQNKYNSRSIYVTNLFEANQFINCNKKNNKLILFRWDGDHTFSEIEIYREFIKNRLVKITHPTVIEKYINNSNIKPFIGINIRSGNDFIESDSVNQNGYRKTSIEWFLDNIPTLRKTYGFLPVYIVSDGSPKKLEFIFSKIRDVHIVNNNTAIEDLLFLSKANVLMGSGNSSFSAWASFLGNMPTYCSKETSFDSFKLQNVEII